MEAETDTEVFMVVVMDMVVEVMAEVEAAVEVMGEAEVMVVEAVEVMGEAEVNKVCLLTGPSQNRFKKSNTLFKGSESSQLMILMSLLSNVT